MKDNPRQRTTQLCRGILATIGGTPLVELTRIFPDEKFRLFAKLEGFNPGGSIKDRTAFHIIKDALECGQLRAGMTVIESSSGNMGIGLAQACAYWGLRFICVVDPKTTQQNLDILHAYGAELDIIWQPDATTGEFLKARIDRVAELLLLHPDGFWPNQYSNLLNARAHHETMHEIVSALDGEVDYLFCSTSTCGTLRGCAEYVRDHELKTKIVAVDAVGSVIFGGQKAKRLIPGHGAAISPKLFQPGLADRHVLVSDVDCVVGCRRLVQQEAILAGGSSGAVLAAIERIKWEIRKDAVCVAIFPDQGERYLDTIYSDTWVSEKLGDIAHQWAETKVLQYG